MCLRAAPFDLETLDYPPWDVAGQRAQRWIRTRKGGLEADACEEEGGILSDVSNHRFVPQDTRRQAVCSVFAAKGTRTRKTLRIILFSDMHHVHMHMGSNQWHSKFLRS